MHLSLKTTSQIWQNKLAIWQSILSHCVIKNQRWQMCSGCKDVNACAYSITFMYVHLDDGLDVVLEPWRPSNGEQRLGQFQRQWSEPCTWDNRSRKVVVTCQHSRPSCHSQENITQLCNPISTQYMLHHKFTTVATVRPANLEG